MFRFVVASCTLIAATAITIPLAAYGDTAIEQDNSLLVTATRIPRDIDHLPANVTVITRDNIRDSAAGSVTELLALEAGINTRSLFGNSAAGNVIDIRGFGASAGQNSLILLNGRRLNEADMAGVDLNGIAMDEIERIEIIRGAGGSLYGDGVVGGAVNIVTRARESRELQMNLQAEAGSFDTQQHSATVGQDFGTAFYRVYLNEQQSDGYRDNNEFRQTNLALSSGTSYGNNEWTLRAGYSNQDLRLPGPRTVDPGIGLDEMRDDRKGTGTPNDYAGQEGTDFTLGYQYIMGDVAELILDLGNRSRTQTSFYDYGFGFTDYRESMLSTSSITPRIRYHFGPGQNHHGVIGLDYYDTQYHSDRTTLSSNIDDPIHRIKIDQIRSAGYFNHTSRFLDSLAFTLGARAQRIRMDAVDEFDSSAPGATIFDSGAGTYDETQKESIYDLGIRYDLTRQSGIFTNYSHAVRFATVDDLYETDPATFAQVFSPLEPQISDTWNLGTDSHYKVATALLRNRLTLYYMRLENEIHFNPVTFTNDNLDATERRGAELDFSAAFSSLQIRLSYTYTRAKFRDGVFEGNDVPLVPKHSASAQIFWRITPHVTFSISDRYVGEKRFDNDQENSAERIPAYEIMDVKVRADISGWTMVAAIYNRFDEQAFDYGVKSTTTDGRYNAYPLPGRHVAIQLGKQF